MSGFKKRNYKGREIIYVDYRGLKEEGMIATATDLREWLLKENKDHLRLINITDCYATPKFTTYIRALGRETQAIPFRGAIVGITGAKRVLLMGYNRLLGGKLKPFDSEDEALEYLVS